MSTVIARRVRAVPYRTAGEFWEFVSELIAPTGSAAREELSRVSGPASAAVSSEAVAHAPIIVCGAGPRVRVYGLFGEDALEDDGDDEQDLGACPTEEDWRVSIPCGPEELDVVRKGLEKKSNRVTARAPDEPVDPKVDGSGSTAQSHSRIDPEAFFKA